MAQSQSRIGWGPETTQGRRREQNQASSRLPESHSYFRRVVGNPYHPASSQALQFVFSSRASGQHAPLFHDSTDDFREDDEQEREKDAADFYALQRSRRHFDLSGLEESSELDDYGGKGSKYSQKSLEDPLLGSNDMDLSHGKWNPESSQHHTEEIHGRGDSERNQEKSRLVDVQLGDTLLDDHKDHLQPPIQKFKKHLDIHSATSADVRKTSTAQGHLIDNLDLASSSASPSPLENQMDINPPKHDIFWGKLFIVSLGSLFATSFIVYLNTRAPVRMPVLGDTIYSVIHSSFSLLFIYTLISVIVSLAWIMLLNYCVSPLVCGMLVLVPFVLYSFSLYTLISSFRHDREKLGIQSRLMCWASLLPAMFATGWIYFVFHGRHCIRQAIRILEFASRIIAANQALFSIAFASLGLIIAWTWLWILMFSRVFLSGHVSSSENVFLLNSGSWLLGIYFILIYLWSLGVISGIARTTTAASVSQWYFHRLVVPSPSSPQIVQAALRHSVEVLFGTICFSASIALLVRAPFLVLPKRLSSLLSIMAYSVTPTPLVTLTNPLTLTYAAVHSVPLSVAARSFEGIAFFGPSISLEQFSPQSLPGSEMDTSTSLRSYCLSKLILHSTRLVMSFALGFMGWIATAYDIDISGSMFHGSLYAYVVGLIAGIIGWSVLGAVEGIMDAVVDAAIICWASEVGNSYHEARYCREAGELFGGVHQKPWPVSKHFPA